MPKERYEARCLFANICGLLNPKDNDFGAKHPHCTVHQQIVVVDEDDNSLHKARNAFLNRRKKMKEVGAGYGVFCLEKPPELTKLQP